MIWHFLSRKGASGAVAALIVSLAGAGFSAHAGLTRGAEPAVAPPLTRATGYEAEAHFPGAQLIYAAQQAAAPAPADLTPPDPLAAPSTGVTGTIALPSVPVPQAAAIADIGVQPARPFALPGSAQDQARAMQCLTAAIYYEAASEPDDGQSAVAQVVLNRVRHPAFPATVCGVVYQGSERRGCQFSFACDGSMARVPMRSAWERARRAAARALAGYVYAPVGLATHYHTYAVTPAWNRTLVMTDAVGAHFFHRWKGWWGTAAAFTQRYAGGEPVPGPHAPIAPLAPPVPTSPLFAQGQQTAAVTPDVAAGAASLLKAMPVAATPAQNVTAEYRSSGSTLPQYAAGRASEESQILDRWKDSGKPLR